MLGSGNAKWRGHQPNGSAVFGHPSPSHSAEAGASPLLTEIGQLLACLLGLERGLRQVWVGDWLCNLVVGEIVVAGVGRWWDMYLAAVVVLLGGDRACWRMDMTTTPQFKGRSQMPS
eukprot:TRINITY_DN2770_c0_g1_i1.p1 TRINITY_DN2770_c0_g1~~TRINITY_DN2770_c0_g1_i1.p1  ORF type:complete len:126 (+),score=29.14 TRINITY_DN2770_c0_g1_i1:29-379(+)